MTMCTMADRHLMPRDRAGNLHDAEYSRYLERVQQRFAASAERGPLFETDAGQKLWEAYLSGYHPSERQYHNCNACRRFVERFGGLVTINANGVAYTAVWHPDDCADARDSGAIANMLATIRHAKIVGPFVCRAPVWGMPETGVWRHLALRPFGTQFGVTDAAMCSRRTDDQLMAEKREDFKNVRRALHEFSRSAVEVALGLLKSEALFRGEKVLGQAQWLHDVQAAVAAAPKPLKDNVLWHFVATAPAGFCHPRSSMIGTLLEDIEKGVSFETAARNFRIKMDPSYYQRPQAAPSAGNIARAERLVAELGIDKSLERRFARVEELKALWRPRPAAPEPQTGGVFSHLTAKGAPAVSAMVAPTKLLTFEKFARTVLPEAREIEVKVPGHGGFCAFVTAAHPDAPPILQWDRPERRNPVSQYTYLGGSYAAQWRLQGNTWAKVMAVVENPAHWFAPLEATHHERYAIAVIEGAIDTRPGCGNGLFPEIIRSDLREIRLTIAAYSNRAEIQGRAEGTACGVQVVGAWFRVTDGAGNRAEYQIDRWD